MENELKIYARYFYNFGFNITCVTNYLTENNFIERNLSKSPYHKWTHFESDRQTLEELLSYDWEKATGLGVVLGFEKLRAIDIDGCTDISIVNQVLEILSLPKNYEWVVKSGSHNGYHIIVYSDADSFYAEKGKVTAFLGRDCYRHMLEKIEFRWSNHLVLPPSIHKSTLKYKFINTILPKSKPLEIKVKALAEIVDRFVEQTEGNILTSHGPEKGFHIQMTVNNSDKIELTDEDNPLYLIFKVETDGLPLDYSKNYREINNWPELIQIGWIVMNKYGHIYKKDSEVVLREKNNPVDLVNIDFSQIKMIGKPVRSVLEKFLLDTEKATYLVAHNIDYDLNVIQASCLKNGLTNNLNKLSTICTMKSAVDYCAIPNKFGNKFPSLEELYSKLFNKEMIRSYNAENDVLAIAKCFWKLKESRIIESPNWEIGW